MNYSTVTPLAAAIALVLTTALSLASAPASAGEHAGRDRVFMITAGTLNVNVVQLQINNPTDPDDDAPEPVSLIEEKLFGTLGPGELRTFAKVTGPADPANCPEGFPIPLVVTNDTVVITMRDLSQLIGTGETTVCLAEDFRTQGISGHGTWVDGTRRFADVTGGDYALRSTAVPQSANGQFYSTNGSIRGRLDRD